MTGPDPRRPSGRRLVARTVAAGAVATGVALFGTGTALAQQPAPTPGGNPQQATPTERAAAQARPAIVYLQQTFRAYVADQDGAYFNNGAAYQIDSSCTGFGVNPQGYIATAGHCVDTNSAEGIRAEFIKLAAQDVKAVNPALDLQTIVDYGTANWVVEGTAKGSPIESKVTAIVGAGTGGSTAGETLPARVVDFRPNSQGDVALLKVESSDLPSVELEKATDVPIGTQVLSIGYPASADSVSDVTLEPSNKDGQVSTRRTIGSVPFYETSASLSPGMSGGPTVDLKGQVVGVNSAFLRGDQAFNFIAPATGMAELMARNGVQNQLGPNDALYRSSLDAYYAGHYSDAIAGFERLLLVDPEHKQAQQYKTLAAKAKAQFGDTPVPAADGGSGGLAPWLLWTLVGGGAAVVLAVVLVLVLKRRRGGASAAAPAFPALPAGSGASPYGSWNPGAQGGPGAGPQGPAAPYGAGAQHAPGPQFGAGHPQQAGPPSGGMAPAPWGAAAAQPPAQPPRDAAPGGTDGPTTVVTPADILAAQRPAPRESVQGAPTAPAGADRAGTPDRAAATVVVPVPEGGTCPGCGSSVAPSAAFCSTCGTKQH